MRRPEDSSNWGGKRTPKPGKQLGRPPKSRTLKDGDTLLMHETMPDGSYTLGGLVTVEIVSRTKIILKHEDGSRIILGY